MATMIGAFVGAAAQVNNGMIAKAQARNESILAGYQADETLRAGTADQNRYRRTLRQFLGKQRAIIGANGIQDLGSPSAVQEDAAAAGEEDIANIGHQAALDAYGIRIGAKDALYRGEQAQASANAGAFETLADAYGGGAFAGAGGALKKGLGKLRGNTGRQYQDTPILNGGGYYG